MSRPTLGERVREAVAVMGGRPGPALLALAVGLVFGLGVRGVAFSGGESTIASTSAASPKPAVKRREPRPKREVKPVHPPQSNDSAARVGAALAAVDSYAKQQGDVRVGAAIVPLDGSAPPAFAGTVESGRPWSVMKVPTAAAYLNFKRRSENAASGEETIPDGSPAREGLGQALVESDNLAIRHRIQEMIDAEGPDATAAAINTMLVAGEARPQISPAIDPSIDSLQIGTGEWALEEAARWFRRLQVGSGQCLGIAQADRVFILRQLRAAPEALHWGAAIALDNGDIALKPGWGSNGGIYTVEQAVIVGNGSEAEGFPSLTGGYAMALMAVLSSSDPAAFTEGQHQLAELAGLIEQKMGTPGPGVDSQPASTC